MSEHDDSQDMSAWDDMSNEADDSGKKQSRYDDGKSLFLKWEIGKSYTIRLIQNPACFRQHWQAFKPVQRKPIISPAYKESERDKDIAWVKGGWKPQKRYAVPVINREMNKIQIMEGGPDVFNPILNLYLQTKKKAQEGKGKVINPAGEPAPDWIITVGSTPMKNGKEKKVITCQIDVSSGLNYFSEEDKALISKFTYDWKKIYAKKTPEEIEELWNSLPEDKKYDDSRKKQFATANPGEKKTAEVEEKKDSPPTEESPFEESPSEDGDNGEEGEGGEDQAATLF